MRTDRSRDDRLRKQPRQSYLCLRDVARRSDFCNAIRRPFGPPPRISKMEGKIWPTREQIYAAKSVLPIEYAPAVTVEDAIAQQQSIFLSSEYMEFEKRALRVLRKHPEVLADWITEFGDPLVAIDGYDNGYRAEEPINARDTAGDGWKQQPPPNEVGDG